MSTKKLIKALGLIIVVALLAAALPLQVKAQGGTPDTSWYGDGTATSFTLTDADDLAGLAVLVNGGNSFEGKSILLGNDISISTYTNWTPIGTVDHPFKGTFDGVGKKISDLSINNSTAVNVGLFGRVWPGTLKNVSIENVEISAKESVGSLVGSMNGTIENVHVSNVTINSTHWAGGIVGYHYGDMSDCSATDTDITLTFDTSIGDNGDKAGGLIGYHGEGTSAINNCTAERVSVTGVRDVGGLVGAAQTGNVFTNCHVSDSTVTASKVSSEHASPYAGGIIGRAAGATVTLQYSSAVDVTVTSYVEGFAGNLVGGPAANWVNLPVMLVSGVNKSYYGTIQAAIDAAAPGDTINVAAGTYVENLQINKAVNLIGLQNTRTFESVVIGDQAPDVWYVDRFAPAAFESFDFGGRKVLRHGVLGSEVQSQSFYNYQGRKLDVNLSGPTITVSVDLFVGSNWGSEKRNAGFWATGLDSNNDISAYPMIAWRSGGTDPAGFYAFDYFYGGWLKLKEASDIDYGEWHNLAFTYNVGEGISYFIDGEFSGSFADSYTTQISNIILNVYNFGENYDVYWDNLTNFTNEAKVTGLVNISADNVVVDGFTLENPGQSIAVDINSTASIVTLKHNVIQNVGGSSVGQMQAVYLEHGPDNVLIEGNTFKDISSGTSSAKAILSGDSNTTDPAENLIIRANTFSNISAYKGAFGVLLNNKAGNPGVIIEANAFNGISGAWTHAIGLEGPTANAKIENNAFAGLTATTPDNSAIFFEDNSAGGSVAVKYNKFFHNGLGVGIHPDDQLGGTNNYDYTVKAWPNWWGSISGPVVSTQIFGPITYDPWCGDAECSFLNPNYLEDDVTADGIQDAIDDAQEGEIIVIPAGTHSRSGGFTIGKAGITIRLADGAVIQNSSPCFTVEEDADNVTITSETLVGGKCVPTDEDHGIVVKASVEGLRIVGIEIDGSGQTTGDGIHFEGAITNFQIVNNYIHDLDGSAINFVGTPSGTTMDIQGNLFKTVGTPAIGVPADLEPDLNAEYNSWGAMAAPEINDVTTDPNTHVKVFVQSSGTPWSNQVVAGNTIKYTVKAELKNVTGAELVLLYPEGITAATPVISSGNPFDTKNVSHDSTNRRISFYGWKAPGNPAVPEGTYELFTVTFTVPSAGSYLLSFDLATDNFAMAPDSGPSNNVYADSLTGATIKAITLPTMTSDDIDGPYLAGVPQNFGVTVNNPPTGGNFDNSIYYVFNIEDAELEDIFSLTCEFIPDSPTTITLEESGDNLVGRVGYGTAGFPMAPGLSTTTTCEVQFVTPGSYLFTVDMVDNTTDDPANDIPLTSLTDTAVVNGNFAITGTFSMQGRVFRGGIPVTLTWNGTGWTYAASDTTEDLIVNNFQVTVTYGGEYLITTNQPRYLNVTAGLGAKIDVSTLQVITPLELKAGNVVDSGVGVTPNIIDTSDAGFIGGAYGASGDPLQLLADANFDGIVNIQDLALVGSNYLATSESAYGNWMQ